jgi:hypothetical protein
MLASERSWVLTAVTLRGVSCTDMSVPKTELTGVSVGRTEPSVFAVTTMVCIVPVTGPFATLVGAEVPEGWVGGGDAGAGEGAGTGADGAGAALVVCACADNE